MKKLKREKRKRVKKGKKAWVRVIKGGSYLKSVFLFMKIYHGNLQGRFLSVSNISLCSKLELAMFFRTDVKKDAFNSVAFGCAYLSQSLPRLPHGRAPRAKMNTWALLWAWCGARIHVASLV